MREFETEARGGKSRQGERKEDKVLVEIEQVLQNRSEPGGV
jgi:hypothetical protein